MSSILKSSQVLHLRSIFFMLVTDLIVYGQGPSFKPQNELPKTEKKVSLSQPLLCTKPPQWWLLHF